ncbi:MAG: hypothetical protein U5L01_09515 [Rheinheimera sp.]|nr:hypothetical protein [Rheinheimera sp.]
MLQKLHPLLICALLIALGVVNTFAYAPYQYSFMPLLTLPVLALSIWQAQSPKQAAWFGWSYGVGWFGLGVSWVHVSIATFGGMPLVFSLGIMAALVAYLALFPALAAWLAAFWLKHRDCLSCRIYLGMGYRAKTFVPGYSLVFHGYPWDTLKQQVI